MKKKILLSIAGVAASGVILAGCGSSTTQNETTTAPVTTTAAANTETTAAATTMPTTTAETYTNESYAYNLTVNKYLAGYSKAEKLEYKNSIGDSYEYDIEDNVSSHAIEAEVDSDMADIDKLLDQGRLEKDGATIYYVYGIEDLKYEMKAYKYVGPSGDTSSYLELRVESGSGFSPTELLSLLDNEYITVTAK